MIKNFGPLNDIEPSVDGKIEIIFNQNWKFISLVRSFVRDYLFFSLENRIISDSVATAVSELIENAIKYSSRSDIPIRFKLTFDDKDREEKEIKIEVQNFANEDDIKVLIDKYQHIADKDPIDSYLERIRELSDQTSPKTMLGLARIRYETGGSLDITVEKDLVTITVNYSIKKEVEHGVV